MFRAAISAASTLADSSAGPPAALAEDIGLKNDRLATLQPFQKLDFCLTTGFQMLVFNFNLEFLQWRCLQSSNFHGSNHHRRCQFGKHR